MKNKILTLIILVTVFSLAINVYAVGQNNGAGISNQTQQQTQQQLQDGTGTGDQVKNQNKVQNQGESSQLQNQEQQGKINAEQHKNTVSNFVQSLLQVADKEGGVGDQVKTIAQQQNQSIDTMVQAMEKVQTRSKVKTFFFGSDYKNLGTLRSEIVQTRNRLEQLNKLMENVQNEGDKTELQNQVQILEQEQTKIESFVKDQEGKFSLFGWFVKLFNK